MIGVRVDLQVPERVMVDGDSFGVDTDRMLEIYKGDELVAVFREWSSAVKLDDTVEPPTTIQLPEPRPLNLSPYPKG